MAQLKRTGIILTIILVLLIPLSLMSATLHTILVIDTIDKGIGSEYDLKNWKKQLRMIKKYSGMTLNTVILKDKSWSQAHVMSEIRKLKPEKDDAVLFYYSGHGFRFNEKKNKWPEMALYNSSMDLFSAYSMLKKKKPRFLLTIADSCNNFCPAPSPEVMTLKVDKNVLKKNYRNLFAKARGSVIASGCIAGQYSFGGEPDGGAYTSTLIKNMKLAAMSENATWKQVFEASNKPLVGGKQQPQYEMNVDASNAVINNEIEDKKNSGNAGADVDFKDLRDPEWCTQSMDTYKMFNRVLVVLEGDKKLIKNSKEYNDLKEYITMQMQFMRDDKDYKSEKVWKAYLDILLKGDWVNLTTETKRERVSWGEIIHDACKKKSK